MVEAADAFNDVIPDTKRAIEVSKVYNAKIDPLLDECRGIRNKLDVYMQTFIVSNPTLYDEWKETLSIDDAATNNPPVLTLEFNVEAGETYNVDYEGFSMFSNSEIKLMNPNDADALYGFGDSPDSFTGTPTTVLEQNFKRKTASSLNYHSVTSNYLNVRNDAGTTLLITLEFYDMS